MTIFDGLADIFTGALGQPVTVTPAAGSPRVINAIFVARAVDNFGVVQPQPAIHARASDVADLMDGAAVAVGSATYAARGFKADGRGMVTITLEDV